MLISRKFYTGPFCNTPENYEEEAAFDEHPQNIEFLNPTYPYLNQFLKNIEGTQVCFGISLWKIETKPEISAMLNAEEVHKLITSNSLLKFQLWKSNGNKGLIKEKDAPGRDELIKIFTTGLYQMQIHGENRVEVPRNFCKSLSVEFLETLEAESGKVIRFFNIQYGWADWFALDSHYDFGFLMATETALWLLTFSESD